MNRVFFVRENKTLEFKEPVTILEAERAAGLIPDAPCGGAGKCGKCLVRVDGQMVKACQTLVEGDIQVETPDRANGTVVLTEGSAGTIPFQPSLSVHKIRLTKAEPGEKRSDWERMLDQLAREGGPDPSRIRPDLTLASSLYERSRQASDWYVIHTDEEIFELRPEEGRRFFAAFDIGTTTLAGYLLDAADGRTLAVESAMNPQAQYGADVIMRANYALEHGVEVLADCIRTAIDEMLGKLADKAGADRSDIFQVCVVGNTCMQHLFLGISPASLVHAPYTPAISSGLTLCASDYGISIQKKGQLLVLPDIAGYVGADTCGCLLAVRPDQKEEITLLLDIGTNGEMVLGSKDRLVACSTAAGPAFEGAKISCGMRGAAGAVDHVYLKDGEITYSTVGNVPAVGICGSGLIDLVAVLLKTGAIDDSGRLQGNQADGTYMFVPPESSGNGQGICLTQKDIREVQLAKAAIAAGIQLLMKELSVTEEQITQVYIAGAFGNYMDPRSAAVIGMIPHRLADRVRAVGNAAGEGAQIALLNRDAFQTIQSIAKQVGFVELAASEEFQDCFVDELSLPSIQ